MTAFPRPLATAVRLLLVAAAAAVAVAVVSSSPAAALARRSPPPSAAVSQRRPPSPPPPSPTSASVEIARLLNEGAPGGRRLLLGDAIQGCDNLIVGQALPPVGGIANALGWLTEQCSDWFPIESTHFQACYLQCE